MFGIFGSPREAGKVKDPVCQMEIDPKESKYSLEYQGKKYYFCSESCQKKFNVDSNKYVAVQQTDASRCCCH